MATGTSGSGSSADDGGSCAPRPGDRPVIRLPAADGAAITAPGDGRSAGAKAVARGIRSPAARRVPGTTDASFPRHRSTSIATDHHRAAIDRPVPTREAGVTAREGIGSGYYLARPRGNPTGEPVPADEAHVPREETGMMTEEHGPAEEEIDGCEGVEGAPDPPENGRRPPPAGMVRPPSPRLIAYPRPPVRRDPGPPPVIVRLPAIVHVRPPGVPVLRRRDPLAVLP